LGGDFITAVQRWEALQVGLDSGLPGACEIRYEAGRCRNS